MLLGSVAYEHCVDANAAFRPVLVELSSRLLDIGSRIATPLSTSKASALARTDLDAVAAYVAWLEADIDSMDASLPELKNFIVPCGGGALSAQFHVARFVLHHPPPPAAGNECNSSRTRRWPVRRPPSPPPGTVVGSVLLAASNECDSSRTLDRLMLTVCRADDLSCTGRCADALSVMWSDWSSVRTAMRSLYSF